MAFFIKPFGFDQIDRYAQNRGIECKEFGYMLRGAIIGYAAFPKTFTDVLYANADIYIPMDEYLTVIHKLVETQCSCNWHAHNYWTFSLIIPSQASKIVHRNIDLHVKSVKFSKIMPNIAFLEFYFMPSIRRHLRRVSWVRKEVACFHSAIWNRTSGW